MDLIPEIEPFKNFLKNLNFSQTFPAIFLPNESFHFYNPPQLPRVVYHHAELFRMSLFKKNHMSIILKPPRIMRRIHPPFFHFFNKLKLNLRRKNLIKRKKKKKNFNPFINGIALSKRPSRNSGRLHPSG